MVAGQRGRADGAIDPTGDVPAGGVFDSVDHHVQLLVGTVDGERDPAGRREETLRGSWIWVFTTSS